MTCLKPTVGSTVREGTEALPSLRPSQQAAAQGKVHTRAHNTHKVGGRFPGNKNSNAQLHMFLMSSALEKSVCICTFVIIALMEML